MSKKSLAAETLAAEIHEAKSHRDQLAIVEQAPRVVVRELMESDHCFECTKQDCFLSSMSPDALFHLIDGFRNNPKEGRK